MEYPKEFIEKCKAEYPELTNLHELLNSGNLFAGRYLDDSCSTSIPIQTILEAKSLNELQKKAKIQERRVALYVEWCELYRNQSEA